MLHPPPPPTPSPPPVSHLCKNSFSSNGGLLPRCCPRAVLDDSSATEPEHLGERAKHGGHSRGKHSFPLLVPSWLSFFQMLAKMLAWDKYGRVSERASERVPRSPLCESVRGPLAFPRCIRDLFALQRVISVAQAGALPSWNTHTHTHTHTLI